MIIMEMETVFSTPAYVIESIVCVSSECVDQSATSRSILNLSSCSNVETKRIDFNQSYSIASQEEFTYQSYYFEVVEWCEAISVIQFVRWVLDMGLSVQCECVVQM